MARLHAGSRLSQQTAEREPASEQGELAEELAEKLQLSLASQLAASE
jgi:hypothetical protein